MEVPTTSTTMLKVLGEDAKSPRWTEFADRYLPVMSDYLAQNYPWLEPDDIIQETLITLVAKLPDYRYAPDEKGHFRNYLIGIVHNKAREMLRAQRKIANSRDAAKLDAEIAEDLNADAEGEAERRQWQFTAYEVALQQLLADQRIQDQTKQIFVRTALNDESPDDVARMFGITRNNVDQIKNRMTAKLRELAKGLSDV